MKVKLSEIVESIQPLKSLLEVKLPVKTSYRIKRLTDRLNPIISSYEERQNALVKEYGVEVSKDRWEVKDPEMLKTYFEKLNEMLAIEEEVEFEPIKVSDLGEVSLEPKNIVPWIFIHE